MSTSNCFVYAVAMFIRRGRRGKRCYIDIRWSDEGRFPHFCFSEWRRGKLRMTSYRPLPNNTDCLPWPWFEGKVYWGDPILHKALT